MNKNIVWKKLGPLLLVLVLLLAACGSDDNANEPGANDTDVDTTMTVESPDTDINTDTDMDTDMEATAPVDETSMNDQSLDSWLQQVNKDQIESDPIGETLDWSEGYLVYYGPMDSIGIDNLIYNALEVHRRLDTGEVTEDNLSESEQNLLEIAEGIEYDSEADLTDQVAQTPEIRSAIMEHITQSQADLTPEEALASNNIIGVFGPPAPESIGSKYLVYTQDSPDAEYSFLGVILAVDATSQASMDPYSAGEWNDLRWLGDATGPFWDDLPAGVSGDASSTDEGRPGVLLVSEATFDELNAQSMR
ncbi:MAG: hypothetical protein IPM53_05340 [Anaerolineaceae bacterium]|nr:hypothetical protein [Anaerolineaceae bacterium]